MRTIRDTNRPLRLRRAIVLKACIFFFLWNRLNVEAYWFLFCQPLLFFETAWLVVTPTAKQNRGLQLWRKYVVITGKRATRFVRQEQVIYQPTAEGSSFDSCRTKAFCCAVGPVQSCVHFISRGLKRTGLEGEGIWVERTVLLTKVKFSGSRIDLGSGSGYRGPAIVL